MARNGGFELFSHLMEAFIDSRKSYPGGIFFALRGEKVDGVDFLEEVSLGGAREAVVPRDYAGPTYGLELTRVPDVKEELQRRAEKVLKERGTRVIGITGSIGKTTTRSFAKHLLEGSFRVAATEGNQNSQVSLPLTVLNSDPDADYLLLEMGMSRPGELTKLAQIARPEIAIITRISHSHAENFASLEEIAKAKAEIFSAASVCTAIVSEQAAPYFDFHEKKLYGFNHFDSKLLMTLPFKASHLQENFMAAASLARYLGVGEKEILKRARSLKPFERRFESRIVAGIHFINDAYNANVDSMTAALQALPKPRLGGRTYAVLGHMVELGVLEKEAHRQVGEVAANYVDELFTFGKGAEPLLEAFKKSGKRALFFTEKEPLLAILKLRIKPGDVVLVKGSNPYKLWEVIECLSSFWNG